MKKLIIIILFLFVGCTMSKPNLQKDYVGLSEFEKKLQYRFDKCTYAQQYTKSDLRCIDIIFGNKKIYNILDFKYLNDEKKLPKLFNKNGEYEMTFDDFYKYIN